MIISIATTATTARHAQATVSSLRDVAPQLEVRVLDIDDAYQPQGSETIFTKPPADLPVNRLRLTHRPAELGAALTAHWAAATAEASGGEPVLAAAPGIVFLQDPAKLGGNDPRESVLIRRNPDPLTLADAIGSTAPELYLIGAGAHPRLAALRDMTLDWELATRAAELALTASPHRIVGDLTTLVSRGNSDAATLTAPGARDASCGVATRQGSDQVLARDGGAIVALDLSGFDPANPWVFDSRPTTGGALVPSTGPLFSRNRELADLVWKRFAVIDEDPRTDPSMASRSVAAGEGDSGPYFDAAARTAVVLAAESGEDLAAAVADEANWLLELVAPPGDAGGQAGAVARYLLGAYHSRADLPAAFFAVPGRDSRRLALWAAEHGLADAKAGRYDAALMARAAELTLAANPDPDSGPSERPHGVNLIGFFTGGLGLGVAARLMEEGLRAANVPLSTFPIAVDLNRKSVAKYEAVGETKFDISLLAVNEGETRVSIGSLNDVVAGTCRIGYWYWELEDFVARDNGWDHLDEIWVATEFIKNAIEPHSPIPVRKVVPPLPQRPPGPTPTLPAAFDLFVQHPYFLFAFDYNSEADRKNPWGVLDAFQQAFQPGEGPLLVFKTINSNYRPAEAERLRLLAAGRPDVVVIDDYLPTDALNALMANCAAYVSLHRGEGLGLTIAEAMAWGRPVIVPDYSGNLEFTNSSNAYLIPTARVTVPEGNLQYPAGAVWGDPDIAAATRAMRFVIENPTAASAISAQAAVDIATLHSPDAAAPAIRAAIDAARTAHVAKTAADKARAKHDARLSSRILRRVARELRR